MCVCLCASFSQRRQGGFEEGVVVRPIDSFGLSLFGLVGHWALGGGRAGRFTLGQKFPLSLDLFPLLVNPLLLPE